MNQISSPLPIISREGIDPVLRRAMSYSTWVRGWTLLVPLAERVLWGLRDESDLLPAIRTGAFPAGPRYSSKNGWTV